MFEIQTVITEKCNMACKYCYMKNRSDMMSKDIFDKSYDFIINKLKPILEEPLPYSQNQYTISLFGGEPLLNFPLIKDIGSDTKYKDIYKSFPTNGILLTQEILDECKTLNINYSLSFDATGNEYNRLDLNNKSTLSKYNELHFSIMRKQGCKCMISPDNLSDITNMYMFFVNKEIYFPDFTIVRDDIWSESDVKQFDVILSQIDNIIVDLMNKNILSLPGFYSLILSDIINANVNGKRTYGCFADATMGLAIIPNGDIYPCARYGSERNLRLADVNNNKIDYKTINFLHSIRNILNIDKCRSCVLYKYCNTQCYYTMLKNGSNEKLIPVDNICEITKYIFKHASDIFLLYKNDENFIKYFERRLNG